MAHRASKILEDMDQCFSQLKSRLNMSIIFIVHFAATFFMLGIIWFVQLVHYPLLGEISKYRTDAYEQTHMRMATWVVAPPMIVELVSGIMLLLNPQTCFPQHWSGAGLALLLVIWTSTAFLQAPKHKILAVKYVEKTHRALITSNRIRTTAWTLRSIILVYALVSHL